MQPPNQHRRFLQAAGDDLTTRQLHDLLELRTAVFVVEQDCPYQEVDGLDLQPETIHLWLSDDEGIAASLRILTPSTGTGTRPVRQIGRVVTRTTARGQGLAKQMMAEALDLVGNADVILNAQTYLQRFYEECGFVLDGSEFIEDGIPHLPMRRKV